MEPLKLSIHHSSPLITPHYSREDWQFIGLNWPNYDLVTYITPPSSLSSKAVSGKPYYGHSVLKTYPCLPEIQIVNNAYFQSDTAGCHEDYFRGQAYPIAARYHPDQCYFLIFDYLKVTFRRIIYPLAWTIASHTFSPSLPLNTWIKYRFKIWDYPSPSNPLNLVYRFEIWETDHWTSYLDGSSDVNIWSGSATNYYGTFLNYYGLYVGTGVKIDDTVILVPAT